VRKFSAPSLSAATAARDVAVAGEQQHNGLVVARAQHVDHLQAGEPGHLEVREDDVRRVALVQLDPRPAVERPAHAPPAPLEELREGGEQDCVVVDEQDRAGHAAAGADAKKLDSVGRRAPRPPRGAIACDCHATPEDPRGAAVSRN
jgi:hypothetical protein